MDKKLKLMRFWLFGIFVIVFAAFTAYMALWAVGAGGTIWMAVINSWPIYLITAVLCAVAYYGYKWYLGRKSKKK